MDQFYFTSVILRSHVVLCRVIFFRLFWSFDHDTLQSNLVNTGSTFAGTICWSNLFRADVVANLYEIKEALASFQMVPYQTYNSCNSHSLMARWRLLYVSFK